LKNLRKDSEIQILPADKGRATVIMEKGDYERKVQAMLEDGKTYAKIDKDPTHQYKRKLVAILTRLKGEGKLSEKEYKEFYPTSEKYPDYTADRKYINKIHHSGPLWITRVP